MTMIDRRSTAAGVWFVYCTGAPEDTTVGVDAHVLNLEELEAVADEMYRIVDQIKGALEDD